MQVFKADKIKSRPGGEKHFTGTVQIDEIIEIAPPTGVKVYRVFFAPGARTDWHIHPEGQVLHIVKGMGRVGNRGGSVIEISPDDVVYICPGEEHWHGAAPGSSMTHYAISPVIKDEDTIWKEKVTDEEYNEGFA